MTQTITIKDPAAPASPAQVSYLNSLVTQRDLPAVAERYALMTSLGMVTKGQASEWIDALLKAPVKTVKTVQASIGIFPPVTPAPIVPELAPQPEQIKAPLFGYYQVGESLYHWDVTGKDYLPQLRRLVVKTSYTGAKTGSWKKEYAGGSAAVKTEVTYTPYGGKKLGYSETTKTLWVPKMLMNLTPLTLDEVAKLGKAYTFCIRCGAQLTDPVSVANGIGPICAKYWSL